MRWTPGLGVIVAAASALIASPSFASTNFTLATFTPSGGGANVEFSPPTASSVGVLQNLPGASGYLQFGTSPEPTNLFPTGYAALDALNTLGEIPVQLELTFNYPETFPYEQDLVSPVGTIAFIYDGASPFTVDGHSYAPGADILSITPNYLVDYGSGSSDEIRPYPEEAEQYQSAVSPLSSALNNSADGNFNLSITGISPPMGAKPGFPNIEFADAFTGDLGPIKFSVGVPEPSTWEMLFVGFGVMGAALRARRLRSVGSA